MYMIHYAAMCQHSRVSSMCGFSCVACTIIDNVMCVNMFMYAMLYLSNAIHMYIRS